MSIIGWVRDDAGFKGFGFNSITTKTERFGEMFVAGTGTDAFIELTEVMPSQIPIADREIHALDKAVVASLMSIGLMLQSELRTQSTLLNYFGGGYEIASFVRGSFSKIDDITFVCWEAEVRGDSVRLGLPTLALKQDYADDILLIRSIRIQWSQCSPEPLALEQSFHAISPVYRDAKQEELEKILPPEMNSRFTCHCIMVQSDGPKQILVRVEYRADRSATSITFNDVSAQLTLSVNQDFVNSLTESIQKQYQLNTPA